MTPTLRPYQLNALDAIATAYGNGSNRVLVKMPTGTGKTVMFASMNWADYLPQFPKDDRKMLVIAHREELLTQAQDKIRAANPGLMVSIEQGPNVANRYSDVVIASIQTLAASKFRRLKRLLQHHTFRIVIVDEAHHAAAATYRTALVHLGFLPPADATDEENVEAPSHDDLEQMSRALGTWDAVAPQDRLLVGVTATPNRSDAIGLGCVFQTIAYSYGLKQAIQDGWLVPITAWVVETSSSLDDVKINRGDFNQGQLAEAVNNQERNRLAVKAWGEYAEGLPTLGFTVNVQHAHDLAGEFVNQGIRAEALSGETPTEQRRALLRDYSARRIDVITNCMVLTEGTDLPLTECILHAKPTKSATLYEQMTGRGLRIFPNKSNLVVIDLVDVARRHSLQTAPVLYGLPPSLTVKGKSLKQVEEELEKLREQFPKFDIETALAGGRATLEEMMVRAQNYNVWEVQELGAFGAGRALNWVKVGADEYRLAYPWADGTETLTVAPDLLGHYSLSLTLRPHGGGPPRQRTIGEGLPSSDAAAKIAEAFVLQERRSTMKLMDREAPWRTRPASSKQLALLRTLRVPVANGKHPMTAGEASDLITLAKQRGTR